MAQKSITKTLHIEGMTCANCESRIERALKKTRGVTQAQVRYGSGTATISFDESEIKLEEIVRCMEALGYKVATGTPKASGKATALQVAGVLTVLFALYLILRHAGVLQIFNAFPQAEAGMGYGMLFVIGLLTSLHCVAMCGGITLSQCVPQQSLSTAGGSQLATFRASFLYNLGRVLSYTLMGGLVGAVGSVVSFSGAARGIVQLLAGIFMVIMGLNMLGLFPWLRKLTPRMPKAFARKIEAGKKSNSPLYVGLFNGLMPCGPLQAMQLYALSTGSPLRGALSMLLFSLGTVPLMFGLGAVSSLLSKRFTGRMMGVSAVLVVVLGLFMFQSGLGLSGIGAPSLVKPSGEAKQAAVVDQVQTVTSQMSPSAYEAVTVKAGIPVKWTLQAGAEDLNGCNNAIIIPAYGIEKKLQPGENVIEFTPENAGTIPFSCWMGMIQSRITVLQ